MTLSDIWKKYPLYNVIRSFKPVFITDLKLLVFENSNFYLKVRHHS